jgi:hypothetical protein
MICLDGDLDTCMLRRMRCSDGLMTYMQNEDKGKGQGLCRS